ncbi:MAG: monofunctional biosynthetic peptidoglycan transglycosylase [Rikenellaceae bacterium]|jgi:monofunctional biosynthetic peptidoglycan transglycosylase|nr:monofunctional biosynthetic peptidoglycan transglycosylase [Rikenellaceae bacterium]
MKYLLRLLLYLTIALTTFSLCSVLLTRFIPVTFTPLKFIALWENRGEDALPLRSRWVSLERISPEMVRAVVATEDNNFMIHSGFDFDAIKQAIAERREGGRLRGASTISQQTAKNVFCLPSRTWVRKGVEAWFTFLIERCWGKKRIMEVYLNVIETHPNMYGAEATARYFYEKPASDLNRYEAAMIASVLPNPRRMNIGAPSSYLTRRAAQVRRLMAQVGEIDFDRPPVEEKNKEK